MLVIGRQNGDSLDFDTLNGPMKIKFRLRRNKISLVIDAPRSIRVRRSELLKLPVNVLNAGGENSAKEASA